MISYAASWEGSNKIIYDDKRNYVKDFSKDRKFVVGLWKLIKQADIIIGHNIDRFDLRKINQRLVANRLSKPRNYLTIDTLKEAKKHFGFTSNSLSYLAKYLGVKTPKSEHSAFPGIDLWIECQKGNKRAWKEMEKYNKLDVVVLKQVYERMRPFINNMNLGIYDAPLKNKCLCGSTEFIKNGHAYLKSGVKPRYACKKCGNELKGSTVLFEPEIRRKLLK